MLKWLTVSVVSFSSVVLFGSLASLVKLYPCRSWKLVVPNSAWAGGWRQQGGEREGGQQADGGRLRVMRVHAFLGWEWATAHPTQVA